MKVLVIEDNPSSMLVAKSILESQGHLVLTAFDAKLGMSLAKSEHPNLIIMDLELPEVDGFEATRTLKSDQQTAHIPVMALTACAMPEDKKKAVLAGCDSYLTKPFRLEPFLALVNGFEP